MAVSGVGRRGEARGQPGRDLERWAEQGERPLTQPASPVSPAPLAAGPGVRPAQVARGAGRTLPIGLCLSWARDDHQRPLGTAWREPHRGTRWEWGLPSETCHTLASVSVGRARNLEPGRDGSPVPRPCAFGWYWAPSLPSEGCSPAPAGPANLEASKGPGLPDPQPKASELRDHSGGGWASTSWVPRVSRGPPQTGKGPLPSPTPDSPPPTPTRMQHLPAGGAGPAEAAGTPKGPHH